MLGAGEVRLLDLADLYAALAEGGTYRPVRVLENDLRPAVRTRVACFARGGAPGDRDPDRRAPPRPSRGVGPVARDAPAVAWKTGTSYGHRDAWAVGFSARYTIGVWVGNFDGKPRKGISGSQHAGPLLFDLFRAVDREGRRPAPLKPDLRLGRDRGLRPVPPAPGAVLPGAGEIAVPARQSRSSRPVPSTGGCWSTRGRASCWPATAWAGGRTTSGCSPSTRPSWSPGGGRRGARCRTLPRLAAACAGMPDGEPPRIVSPDGATPYRMRREAPVEYQRIALVAQASPGARRLYWYQDGTLVATTEAAAARGPVPRPGPRRAPAGGDGRPRGGRTG